MTAMLQNKTIANDVEKTRIIDELKPEDLVLELYKSYESILTQNLWLWETKRWHELVFCLLATITDPEMSPENIREVVRMLDWANLLDLQTLATLNPSVNEIDAAHPVVVTIATILKNSGFTTEESQTAIATICEAAAGFEEKYEGKVQKYFRQYGTLMLDEIAQNFSFSYLTSNTARKAFAIWLQNTLNMPLPSCDPLSEQVYELLKIDYDSLVKVADKLDGGITG
jgi:hypothetical protein